VARFSQAISEGDGISVIPLLEGDVAALAALAEASGAEALGVRTERDVEPAQAGTALPILVRDPGLHAENLLNAAAADGCVVAYRRFADGGLLEDVYAQLLREGVDCGVQVRDEEELEQALQRVDPHIILISERDRSEDEWDDLERTLDLLPDVPAGKLVISESRVNAREQVVALERAGVDAILVDGEYLRVGADFGAALAELTGR
jgi:indole-3-glycerol phosphate synthase